MDHCSEYPVVQKTKEFAGGGGLTAGKWQSRICTQVAWAAGVSGQVSASQEPHSKRGQERPSKQSSDYCKLIRHEQYFPPPPTEEQSGSKQVPSGGGIPSCAHFYCGL